MTRPEQRLNFFGFGFYWDVSGHEFREKSHSQFVSTLKEKLKFLVFKRWE